MFRAHMYRLATGEIVGWVEAETEQSIGVPGEFGLAVGDAAPADHYRVLDGEIVERATMAPTVSALTIAADGAAECVISDLPDPCRVSVSGAVTAAALVTGGTLTLTSTQPGEIRVSVRADPTHKPAEVIIHAT